MTEFFLDMIHINKSFSRVPVLRDVTFRVRPGEVHALVGENGAGKSTLMKILMGIYFADQGEIRIQDKPVQIHSPQDALRQGISMIHQELNPVPDMSVSENLFMGREIRKNHFGGLSIVNQKEQVRQTKEIFDSMGIQIDPKTLIRSLSVAQIQLVEITKAISLSSRIIIMDEPTSALTEKEVATLFEQIKKLRSNGVGIIYISHKLDEVFAISDRISVLRDGELIGTFNTPEITHDNLIQMMVGREIKAIYPKIETKRGKVAMTVSGLSRGSHFQNISFQLNYGEILGIGGLVGAGRSELVECIFGITRSTAGEVAVNGQPVKIKHPKQAIAHKIALITEDRKLTGLNLTETLESNISVVVLDRISKMGIIDKKKETAATDTYIQKLNIKTNSRSMKVYKLSGGNQQKVVLAKWLLSEPEIIILDEPTRGIDVGAKREIYLLMGELAKAGKAVLMISSEIPELMGLADRIIVLADGHLTGEIARKNFSQELIMQYASNLEVNK
ncbi:MAG: sugar ABC transporter ATP-binding protein [Flexilinea sp.]